MPEQRQAASRRGREPGHEPVGVAAPIACSTAWAAQLRKSAPTNLRRRSHPRCAFGKTATCPTAPRHPAIRSFTTTTVASRTTADAPSGLALAARLPGWRAR
jgi:hypothetical protein